MNSIFGMFSRDGNLLPLHHLEKITNSSARDRNCRIWSHNGIALGWTLQNQPVLQDGIVFVSAGRVFNSRELMAAMRTTEAESQSLTDGEVMRWAYLKWGERCSDRIYGDWAYAAWHYNERRLVLSRDQHGNSSLYYHIDNRILAFATNYKALLAANLVPLQLDELYLAQYLTSWMGFHGERTPHSPIKRLPPAHTASITQETYSVRQYWHLLETPELYLPARKDYVEAFRSVFSEAVHCRLPEDGNVACSMSGGLDSGSVAVTAAKYLGRQGQRLAAFTSVLQFESTGYIKTRFADELPFAQETANFSGNIDLFPLISGSISPIKAIRDALAITPDLCYGAANLYWLLDVQQTARKTGNNVLLSGAIGNGSISWNGDVFSQPWLFLLRQLGCREFGNAIKQRFKNRVRRSVPADLLNLVLNRNTMPGAWCYGSAIHPDFARRLKLADLMLHDPELLPPRCPQERRARFFLPGRSMAGAYVAALNAAYDLEERDPTADARVLSFCFSVPDRIYINPDTGMDRWLIRESMKDLLPDKVRLNRNLGVQAGDLVPRLIACGAEVESALDEISKGPSAEYVDVEYMRQIWAMNQTVVSPDSRLKAVTVLTRGIMAGLLVNQFYAYE